MILKHTYTLTHAQILKWAEALSIQYMATLCESSPVHALESLDLPAVSPQGPSSGAARAEPANYPG